MAVISLFFSIFINGGIGKQSQGAVALRRVEQGKGRKAVFGQDFLNALSSGSYKKEQGSPPHPPLKTPGTKHTGYTTGSAWSGFSVLLECLVWHTLVLYKCL